MQFSNNEEFNTDPFSFTAPKGINIQFAHTDESAREIESYYTQYGCTDDGLGHFLQRPGSIASLYREVNYA